MALGTDHQTTTTGAVFIPELWSSEVLLATESALLMAPKVMRYDSMVQGKGDTIHIPNLSNLSANDKSASTPVTLQSPTETEVQISIDQHKEASFIIEDVLAVQSNYDLMSNYTSKAGYAIAQAVDSDLLGLYSSLTTTDVGTYGLDVSKPVILQGIETLELADVPYEDRYLILDPTQGTALYKIDEFVKTDYLGEYQSAKPTATGLRNRYSWGSFFGVEVYLTNQVPSTAGTPTQIHNVLFQKEAFALAMQVAPRTQSDYILEYLGHLVVVDTIYGVKVLRGDFGVEDRS
jgi:hypothetical protein